MTTVVLLPEPPVEGVACASLVKNSALTDADGVALYRAMLGDVLETLAGSTVDVLVNYPTAEDIPAGADADPESDLRAIAGKAMGPDRFEDVRFEPQVGSDFSAKAGNAITHLLREEEVQSAAALRPCVPRLVRSIVDEGALKLRRADVVIGPGPRGQVFFAGFSAPIDFAEAFADRPVETLTRRAREADLDVDFLRQRTILDRPSDLIGTLSRLQADVLAGKPVPERSWKTVQERGIDVRDGEVVSGTDSS
ncbi:MAG: hypothetical protein ACOCZC_01155 [Halodesulfurarchaeum sp.]